MGLSSYFYQHLLWTFKNFSLLGRYEQHLDEHLAATKFAEIESFLMNPATKYQGEVYLALTGVACLGEKNEKQSEESIHFTFHADNRRETECTDIFDQRSVSRSSWKIAIGQIKVGAGHWPCHQTWHRLSLSMKISGSSGSQPHVKCCQKYLWSYVSVNQNLYCGRKSVDNCVSTPRSSLAVHSKRPHTGWESKTSAFTQVNGRMLSKRGSYVYW